MCENKLVRQNPKPVKHSTCEKYTFSTMTGWIGSQFPFGKFKNCMSFIIKVEVFGNFTKYSYAIIAYPHLHIVGGQLHTH